MTDGPRQSIQSVGQLAMLQARLDRVGGRDHVAMAAIFVTHGADILVTLKGPKEAAEALYAQADRIAVTGKPCADNLPGLLAKFAPPPAPPSPVPTRGDRLRAGWGRIWGLAGRVLGWMAFYGSAALVGYGLGLVLLQALKGVLA